MTEQPSRDPIQKTLDELAADTERTHLQVEDAKQLADETAEESYQMALADFHEKGSARISELARRYNITFAEALTRYGNSLAPRPPGHTAAGPRVGSVVSMTDEERQAKRELKRILASRDLTGLSTEQRQTLSLEEQEFLTRPRNGLEEA